MDSKRSATQNVNSMLDGLIGQANLEYARGNSKDAVKLLKEAIRQAPRNVNALYQISDVYADLNEKDKSFEYRLLAAHMSSKTSAAEWADVGDMALTLERFDEASTCFEKAIKSDMSNYVYYEKRINVLETICMEELAMKTRLQAAKFIDCQLSQISFQTLQELIKMVAEYYIGNEDEDKAVEALEVFILRSKEFNRRADQQHLTLLGMWMARRRYYDCIKSILALQDGITALTASGATAIETFFNNTGYIVNDFSPDSIYTWIVDDDFPTAFLTCLIVSFIYNDMKSVVPLLIDKLLERPVTPDEIPCFLEVGKAYHAKDSQMLALKYTQLLLDIEIFKENADAWFLYGILHQETKNVEIAQKAYEKVIKIQPNYIDARINLSSILQNMGKADQALDTLKDYDLDSCSQLPDERLLIRQAEVLWEQRNMEQYVKCVRMLLIPHFYAVNRMMVDAGSTRCRSTKVNISHTLRKNVFDAVRGSPLEKIVKRLGSAAFAENRSTDDLTGIQLHDYTLKLAELLYKEGRFADMLHVVCYGFLQMKIIKTCIFTFKNLLLFASLKAENYPLAFEFLRYEYLFQMNKTIEKNVEDVSLNAGTSTGNEFNKQQLLFSQIFNAMDYVFCHHQSVSYHRFVMRALAKTPENYPLHMISGNNSLITGSYRHALGEYFRVWLNNRDDPLVCLLIALSFTHMACKKDISSRHMIAMRGITFMKRYQKLRGDCQEVHYNIGRMLHQLGVLSAAIFFYEKVLHQSEVPIIYREDDATGEIFMETAERYDLKRLAGYNLAMIYNNSGNRMLAREILEEFCVI